MCVWVCDPLCGRCKPPRQKALHCPGCGAYNVFDIRIQVAPPARHCTGCGLDVTGLATPQTVECTYSGLLCANPCGRHARETEGERHRTCERNTPPPPTLLSASGL